MIKKNSLFLLSLISFVLQPACASKHESSEEILKRLDDKIVLLDDLDSEVIDYLIENEKLKNPGIVKADIDDDGSEDLVLLTKDKSDLLYITFFKCSPTDCKELSKINVGEFYGLQYIAALSSENIIRESSAFSERSEIPEVRLPGNAIKYVTYGKSHITYYWDNNKKEILSLTTGD